MRNEKKSIDSNLPAGTILLYAGKDIPEGWLPCDGSAMESGDIRYSDLFLAIGRQWNRRGDGDKMFRVPELGYMRLPQASATWAMGISCDVIEDGDAGDIVYIIKI